MKNAYWSGKRVLVTGAAGVIGRVLVRDLVSLGARVLCVHIVPGETLGFVNVEHIQADLSKGVPLKVRDFDAEVIFHLAASFERTEEPPGYWKTSFENNVLLSHLLLRALVPGPSLKVFMFASSYLIYNPEQYLNVSITRHLKETDPILPRNLVGLAKYFTE